MAGINWPGLLLWSTKYHDGTAPSNFSVMSAEDRAFLEKAMEEAFAHVEDPNKALKEAIGQIVKEDRTDESITVSLEVVDRLCDDPDVARNIEKLEGLQPLLDLVREKDGAIRVRTLEILALLFSNNEKIQEHGFKRGALEQFMKLTQESPRGSDDRSKAFRALVALIRQVQKLEETFLREAGGLELMVSLLDPAEDTRTREKVASFILSAACNGLLKEDEGAALADALAPSVGRLAEGGLQYREVLSSCAAELAKVAPTRAAALAEAAQARLAEIKAGAKHLKEENDGDAGAEEASLQQCLENLGPA